MLRIDLTLIAMKYGILLTLTFYASDYVKLSIVLVQDHYRFFQVRKE